MELKSGQRQVCRHRPQRLLIEPYGIEIQEFLRGREADVGLLIEPYGIEI